MLTLMSSCALGVSEEMRPQGTRSFLSGKVMPLSWQGTKPVGVEPTAR